MNYLVSADRAKCDNRDCPSCEDCLRYRAPAATYKRQRWALFKPAPGEIACDEFIRYDKEDNVEVSV